MANEVEVCDMSKKLIMGVVMAGGRRKIHRFDEKE